MADKQIVFEDQDQQYLESILIDKDDDEAFAFLTKLMERLKQHAGFACGFRPFK